MGSANADRPFIRVYSIPWRSGDGITGGASVLLAAGCCLALVALELDGTVVFRLSRLLGGSLLGSIWIVLVEACWLCTF